MNKENTKRRYQKFIPQEVIGKKFNRWTILKFAGRDKNKTPLLRCKCDCGNISTIQWHNVRNGHSRGCRYCKKNNMRFIAFNRISSAWHITKDFFFDNFIGLCSFLFLATIGIIGFITIITFMLAMCWPVALLFFLVSAAYVFYFIKSGLTQE